MAEELNISSAVGASATLHWDGRSGVWGEVAAPPVSAGVRQPSFQVKGAPAAASRASPYWTTAEIGRVLAVPPQAIAWAQEAALVTFSLAAVLLAAPAHTVLPGATGELVWVPWPAQPASPTPAVQPAVLVHAPYTSRQAERVTIVPALPAHDPLLHHIALVLQVAVAAEGVAEQLYAAALTEALVVHFLRRYAASRPPRSARGPAGSPPPSCGAPSPTSRTIWRRRYP